MFSVPHCPAGPQAGQRIASFFGANSRLGRSQRMSRPAFSGRNKQLRGDRTVRHFGVGLSQNLNFSVPNCYNARLCRLECQSSVGVSIQPCTILPHIQPCTICPCTILPIKSCPAQFNSIFLFIKDWIVSGPE